MEELHNMEIEEEEDLNNSQTLSEDNKSLESIQSDKKEGGMTAETLSSPQAASSAEELDIIQNNLYQKKLIKLQNKLESKRIKKNQKVYISMPLSLKQNIGYKDQFAIFGGITVHIDSDIYLESQYQKTSIGDNFRQPLQLMINSEKNRIDCHLQTQSKGRENFEFLIELCRRKQQEEYKELSDLLEDYQKKISMLRSKGNKILKVRRDQLVEIDEEYKQFVDYCFNIINKKDPNEIYRYAIGRMNYVLGDIDIQYCGNSAGYFHLIGINFDMYEQLFLRGKQISLNSNRTDKVMLSAQALSQRLDLQNKYQHRVEYRIKTVDGFDLIVHENVIKISSPFDKHRFSPIDHICQIVECEIDPEQINKLIQFRERLVVENKFNSYDEYMSSLYQENLQDVEYTILSEQFLQKFYPNKYKQSHTNSNFNFQNNNNA